MKDFTTRPFNEVLDSNENVRRVLHVLQSYDLKMQLEDFGQPVTSVRMRVRTVTLSLGDAKVYDRFTNNTEG